MLHFLRNLFLFLGLLKFSPPLWAAEYGSEMVAMVPYCSALSCKAPYEIRNLDFSIPAQSLLEKSLKNAATEEAQIWADTILEGDFIADNKTNLDRAVAIYKNNKLLSYFITYSEGAWDISPCHYDGQNDATLDGCKKGRIIESVYLSPDLQNTFFTNENYARFVEM